MHYLSAHKERGHIGGVSALFTPNLQMYALSLMVAVCPSKGLLPYNSHCHIPKGFPSEFSGHETVTEDYVYNSKVDDIKVLTA